MVLKALALVLADRLPASSRCYHLGGHGGAKAAVRDALDHLPSHQFVLKTDVKAYYASMERFTARIGRRYEHHAEKKRLGTYVQHGQRWVQAGLGTPVDWGRSCHGPRAAGLC